MCLPVCNFREKVPLWSDILGVSHNRNICTGASGRRTRHGSRLVDAAPRASNRSAAVWTGASVVSLRVTFVRSPSRARRGSAPQSADRHSTATSAADSIGRDSKQTHVATRSSRTGVATDAGRLAPVPVFLTRFAVRCPFLRGIDMHKFVLESQNFYMTKNEV